MLPAGPDHGDDPTAMVPSLRGLIDGPEALHPRFHSDSAHESAHEEAAKQVEEHGPGFLTTARQQVTALTGRIVEWGRDHPVRMAAAAAVLIAASGLLVRVMKRKAQPVRTLAKAAKQVKKRVASGVREAATAVGDRVRAGGRRSAKAALAGTPGRGSRSR